jgi:hypothetical protein
MKKLITPLLALSIALVGCASPYKKEGFGGGFDESRLAPNAWKVNFRGNGYTSKGRAEDYALLRSADLTLQSGYNYFVIVGASSDINVVSGWTTPSNSTTNFNANRTGNNISGTSNTTNFGGDTIYISKPSTSNTFVMFNAEPQGRGMVYDAKFLCTSLGTKYEIQCGSVK